jgi:subtilisin family serine protease
MPEQSGTFPNFSRKTNKTSRWQDTLDACNALIANPPNPTLVITCGADYASIFGNDGYSQPNSWCTLIDKNSVPPVSRRQTSNSFGSWGTRAEQSIKSSWGIDRIDQAKLPLNQKYNYAASAGQGVYAYVIDTGCRTTHTEFEGRAVHGVSTCPGCENIRTDDQGHGTFVAGLIGGKVLGVAKKSNIICIKALDSKGSGPNSAIIDGLNWAMKDWQRRGAPPAIINMSLGGGKSEALNRAATTATAMGMHVIVAAGNENMDASQASPASVGGTLSPVVTVGSTNINDAISSFSNYGSVVDIFAPGENVVSAAHTSDTQAKTNSGTSFSCPTVAGVVALALSSVNSTGSTFTPAQMKKLLIDSSGKNLITGLTSAKGASPNRMLYSGVDIAGTPATTTRPPAEQYQYPAPAPSTGLSTGAIVGICVGAVALAGLVGFLVYRSQKKKKATEAVVQQTQYVEPPKQQYVQQPVQTQYAQPQMIQAAPAQYQPPVYQAPGQAQYAAPGYN